MAENAKQSPDLARISPAMLRRAGEPFRLWACIGAYRGALPGPIVAGNSMYHSDTVRYIDQNPDAKRRVVAL